MADIILHHYDSSPFSEKVRLVFGYKGIAWRSVQIPRIMPKPDLMPLTGGYRKTPVLQIGADIYCDTRLILREIERRFPKPPLYGAGGLDLIAAWADSTLFANAVAVVFGTIADHVPQEFKDDRAKMRGAPFDTARMKAALPGVRAQFRAYLRLIEDAFGDGRAFISGAEPRVADFALYHLLWFIRRNIGEDGLFGGAKAVSAWYERVTAFGQGRPEPLDAKAALAIAKRSEPMPVTAESIADESGRKPGDSVRVAADDYGRDPVAGELLAIDDREIILRRSDPAVGTVHVHFPRVGFEVMAA
jgi:glutathione S-transferase